MAVAFVLVLFVRPDPKRIGELLHTHDDDVTADRTAAPLREIVRRPGVLPSLVAGQASFGVMVGIMTLTGSVVVDHHHHAGHDVFPIIGAHVIGHVRARARDRLADRPDRPHARRSPAGWS